MTEDTVKDFTEDQWYDLKCTDVVTYCLLRYGSLDEARLFVNMGHTPESFCDFLEKMIGFQNEGVFK